MNDASLQSVRDDIAELEARQAAHKHRVDPLVREAVRTGLSAIACVFLCLGAAAVAITGHVWTSAQVDTVWRALAAAVAVVAGFLVVKLFLRQLEIPGEITAVPGYSREELMRLHHLKQRLRAS